MSKTEQNIRDYLKSLTIKEIEDCAYFYDVDFDTIPIKTIIRKIDSLYEEIILLENTINNNFKSEDGYPTPDPFSRKNIIEDLKRKRNGLAKLFYNEDIYKMFTDYKNEENKETENSFRNK